MAGSKGRSRVGSGTLTKRGAVATAVAAIVNAAIVLVVPPAIDHPPYDPFSLDTVVLYTVIGVLAATAVYAVILRFSSRPERTFVIVAAAVLLPSFVPDLTFARGMPGATTAGVVLLMVMHVVAAVVAVVVLIRGVRGIV